MVLEFSWNPNLFSIIFSSLWIFRDVLLVIWALTTLKKRDKPKFTSLLLIAGILLLSWNCISIFLPEVAIVSFPDEAELDLFITITFLYFYIPIVLEFLLAVILVLYFYSASYHINKKALLGPGLFLLGTIIYICFHAIAYSIIISLDIFEYITNDELFDLLIEMEYMTSIIADIISVIGFSLIFIYSIYKNDVLFTMFCSLFFAILVINLLRITNNALVRVY